MDIQSLSQKSRNQKWGFFSTLIWGVVVTATVAVSQLLTLIIYAQLVYGDISIALINKANKEGSTLSPRIFVTLIIGGLIICGIIKLKKNSNLKEYLAINIISLKQIITWGLVAFIFIIVASLINYFQGFPQINQSLVNVYNSTSQFWLFIFAGGIAVPIFEELLFRGFLFSGFSSSFLGPIGAIIVTSLLWAASHLSNSLFGMFFMFIAGLAAGTARLKTNSLLTPIMMHSLVNLEAGIRIAIFSA